jgi:hypothetical protein
LKNTPLRAIKLSLRYAKLQHQKHSFMYLMKLENFLPLVLRSSPLSSDNRIMMDSGPEPGRCRRTDGKKWRCSNEPVPQKKYCERHMQRGRQRSRKLVETSQPLSTSIGVSPSSNTNLSISLSVNSSISSSCDPSE